LPGPDPLPVQPVAAIDETPAPDETPLPSPLSSTSGFDLSTPPDFGALRLTEPN